MGAAGSPGSDTAGGNAQGPPEPDEPTLHVALGLFLIVGVPFFLMGVLTILGRAGIYVDAFRGLYNPWPPDVLKPFIGLGVFAATLGYLTYRLGRRYGFHKGVVAGMVFIRNQIGSGVSVAAATLPPPPAADPAPESDELDAILRP